MLVMLKKLSILFLFDVSERFLWTVLFKITQSSHVNVYSCRVPHETPQISAFTHFTNPNPEMGRSINYENSSAEFKLLPHVIQGEIRRCKWH